MTRFTSDSHPCGRALADLLNVLAEWRGVYSRSGPDVRLVGAPDALLGSLAAAKAVADRTPVGVLVTLRRAHDLPGDLDDAAARLERGDDLTRAELVPLLRAAAERWADDEGDAT